MISSFLSIICFPPFDQTVLLPDIMTFRFFPKQFPALNRFQGWLINYTQNKLVCEKCFNQRIDFEYNEDIIFLKENYRRYGTKHNSQK